MRKAKVVMALAAATVAVAPCAAGRCAADEPFVVFGGFEGIGKGKHVVLIAGDDEYRSEESVPQLAKILAVHHGFACTVLFATNPKTGEIDPAAQDNIPGLAKLATADLMVLFLRFRDLPDEQMKPILDYADSGRPIIGLRTSTHAFSFRKHKTHAKWDWRAKGATAGGFGRQVFGETWISHYGRHQKQSTRGRIAKGMEGHPIVRGCEDIWGPSDVYAVTKLHGDCQPLIMGQVLSGMDPADRPAAGKELVPVAWTRTYTGAGGKAARVFTTTMGHVGDFHSEGFRRLLVNACCWCVGLEGQIPARAKADLVGEFKPSPIGFGKHRGGVRAADHAIKVRPPLPERDAKAAAAVPGKQPATALCR